jgi:ABC-type multidrug transport system ATPase subunit
MKVLSGLLLPDGGKASVAGFDIVEQSIEVRKRIGLVQGREELLLAAIGLGEPQVLPTLSEGR